MALPKPPLVRLIEALAVIASSADEQISYLMDFGMFGDRNQKPSEIDGRYNIDEIALQFEDELNMLPGLVDRREIAPDLVRKIIRVDQMLSELSGGKYADFWTVDGLRSDRRWDEIRLAAKECLGTVSDTRH